MDSEKARGTDSRAAAPGAFYMRRSGPTDPIEKTFSKKLEKDRSFIGR